MLAKSMLSTQLTIFCFKLYSRSSKNGPNFIVAVLYELGVQYLYLPVLCYLPS